jgi:hypothetical protein
MLYRYHVYGLTLESELECPELAPAPADAAVDVRIRLGHVDPELEGAVKVGHRVLAAPGIYQIWVEGVARFRAVHGQQIWVDPVPGADARDIRAYLMGAVLGITVLLRGLLPLHACAVEVNGHAVAFCGDSGAGKSTLAAALYRSGFTVLTDDLGVVVPGEGESLFYPGFPRIKLWRSALEHFAMNPESLTRDLARADKFNWPIHCGYSPNPLPLRRLYVLERSSDDLTRIKRLRGSAAISFVCRNTFATQCINPLGLAGRNLLHCGELANSVEVFSYIRPWDLDRLEATLRVFQVHLLSSAQTNRLPYPRLE